MESAKTNVAFFGGSFNPPTVGHQEIVRACLEQPRIDEVWLAPSGERLDKAIGTTMIERVAMLECVKATVFDDDPRLKISTIEQELPIPTHTSQTAEALSRRYRDHRFWYVYGADSYASMPSWHDGERLQQELPLLIVPRENYPQPASREHLGRLTVCASIWSVSSSAARVAIRTGSVADGLVCPAVRDYIEEKQLYC